MSGSKKKSKSKGVRNLQEDLELEVENNDDNPLDIIINMLTELRDKK